MTLPRTVSEINSDFGRKSHSMSLTPELTIFPLEFWNGGGTRAMALSDGGAKFYMSIGSTQYRH